MIRFLTSGESHGERLIGIIDGIPANIQFDIQFINNELKRRQMGFGRSERMGIERDEIQVISGVSNGKTTGNPISISLKNRGTNIETPEVIRPRPGHGDLVGALKYNQVGGRNILERASARETAMRVALASICKLFLRELDIEIYSHVIGIGDKRVKLDYYSGIKTEDLKRADSSEIRLANSEDEKEIIKEIKNVIKEGDSLGGKIEIIGKNIPVGLGSHSNWDDKLDGKIAGSIMSIQGIKSVEIGLGLGSGEIKGSKFQDEIIYDGGYRRKTNHSGGIEAGISNGEDIVVRAAMKPIPTIRKGLKTVNMETKEESISQFERSDACAVPSASIVCESMLSYVLANEILKLLGGDYMEVIKDRYKRHKKYIEER